MWVIIGDLCRVFRLVNEHDKVILATHLLQFLHVVTLLLEYLCFNLFNVLGFNILAEVSANVSKVVHKILPDWFPDHESANVGLALIQEECGLFVCTVIGSDYYSVLESDHKLLFPVYFKSYLDGSFLHKNNFLNLLQFPENDLIGRDEIWLQIPQNHCHEILIVCITPVIDFTIVVLQIGNLEALTEDGKEIFEKERCHEVVLDEFGKLIEDCLVRFLAKRMISILTPSVFKILLNFLF